MNEKISVKEYFENKELLELAYVPYERKVEICRIIIEQCANVYNEYHTIDSVLLSRVSREVFIDAITNLNLSVKDEQGLDGYDQLCMKDELNYIIEECDYLYAQFEEILELMLKDYYNNEGSLRGFFNNLKDTIINRLTVAREDISDFVQNLDAKEIADKISTTMKLNNK